MLLDRRRSLTRNFAQTHVRLEPARDAVDPRAAGSTTLDYRILHALQFNARITNVQLADQVGLPSTVLNGTSKSILRPVD